MLLLLFLLLKKLARVIKIRGLRMKVSNFVLRKVRTEASCDDEPESHALTARPRRGVCV